MMNRILLFLTGILFLVCLSTPKKESPPNIVWLVAEDQSPEFFPMYAEVPVALPYLSALSKDGVVFENAYSPVPVCAPARSALITGMYPTSLGTHNMRTYNGYRTENQPTINIPSYSPLLPEGVKMFTEYLRTANYYCTNNAKEDYNFKKTDGAWDESGAKAHWKKRTPDQPFFAVINFGISHESQIWNQQDKPLAVAPEEVPLPPVFPDTPVVRKDIAVNYSNLVRLDKQIGEIIEALKEEGLYENTLIFFYGDHGGPFPRYKRALYETGIKVPLVIKFPHQEKAGTRDNQFISFIDFAPTVLSLAGIQPPDYMQGKARFGSFKTEPSSYVFATSDRFDEQTDRVRAVRYKQYKYIRNFTVNLPHALPVKYREQMPMMKELNALWETDSLDEKPALWFQTPKAVEEVYNIDLDPYELNNLAFDPEMKEVLEHLRQKLDEWIIETGDLGEIPEQTLLENWFPNGAVPVLSELQKVDAATEYALTHSNKGASIVWKKATDSLWHPYTQPLPMNKNLVAKAVRIGYKDSPLLVLD